MTTAEYTESIADRVLMSFPSGQYCLPALLRVLEIVESEHVPTASVECTARPKLYVNPKFVDEHAATPEKLLILVLHELHHVILGHTRLYPRVTPLDNLVFDCVINATLCQLFPEHEYTSLFTDLYSDAKFPECFLRPADGWSPKMPTPPAPRALREPPLNKLASLYLALYGQVGATYTELRRALRKYVDEQAIDLDSLIGDHSLEGEGSSSDGQIEHRAPVLLEELRRITERWPRPPTPIAGRSPHDMLETNTVKVPPRSPRSALEHLLKKIGANKDRGTLRRPRLLPEAVLSAVPQSDRRAVVLAGLGSSTLLYQHRLPARRRVPSGEKVHVYLDVSGSIGNLVGPLYAAVLTCHRFVHQVVHLFSTKVADVSINELRKGVCHTTGGTSIECVARHIRENQVRRAVIVTDGMVGRPGATSRETLSQTRLGVALVGDYRSLSDLEGLCDESIELKEVR